MPKGSDKTPKPWYRFNALAGENPNECDLYIFDLIARAWYPDDPVVDAKIFIDELNALPSSVETINLHINSPGGDVFQAVPIANALRAHKAKVNVVVEGIAASAATLPMMAGDSIVVAENALVMIHNPWTVAIGDAAELRNVCEMLDRGRQAIIATYQWHSELSAEELGALMDATTWMDADEALANGFATEVGAAVQAAALFDPEMLAKLGPAPEKYQARLEAIKETRTEDDSAGDAGAEAEAVDESEDGTKKDPPAPAPPPPPTPSNVVSITAARESEIEKAARMRAANVVKACRETAKHHPSAAAAISALESSAIEEGLSVEIVSARILDVLAAQADVEIQGAIAPLSRATDDSLVNAIVKGSKRP